MYIARCARKTNSLTNYLIGAFAALMLMILCGGVLVFSWPANMEADYTGFGLLGAFLPVIAVFGGFFTGIAVTLSVKGD